MATEHIYIIPLAASLLFAVTPLATYTLSIALGHLRPLLPYISDTGSLPPESCVFSQLSNFLAVLVFVTVWVRYEQIEVVGNEAKYFYTSLRFQNYVAFWVGAVASVGASMIGNFQETNILFMHMIGVAFGVGGLTLYFIQQTLISYKTTPDYTSQLMFLTRLIIMVVVFVGSGTFGLFLTVSNLKFDSPSIFGQWKPEDPGFAWHITSTIGEWISEFAVASYFLTFAREFHGMTVTLPKVLLSKNEEGKINSEFLGLTEDDPQFNSETATKEESDA